MEDTWFECVPVGGVDAFGEGFADVEDFFAGDWVCEDGWPLLGWGCLLDVADNVADGAVDVGWADFDVAPG